MAWRRRSRRPGAGSAVRGPAAPRAAEAAHGPRAERGGRSGSCGSARRLEGSGVRLSETGRRAGASGSLGAPGPGGCGVRPGLRPRPSLRESEPALREAAEWGREHFGY